jgi:hypothetical protein
VTLFRKHACAWSAVGSAAGKIRKKLSFYVTFFHVASLKITVQANAQFIGWSSSDDDAYL